MRVVLNASTTLVLKGTQYVHFSLIPSFDEEVEGEGLNLGGEGRAEREGLVFEELREGFNKGFYGNDDIFVKEGFVLRSRSYCFSSSVLLLGRISGRDLFDVTHGIVLRDRFFFSFPFFFFSPFF